MCFNFKLFGGRQRHANAANGGISPRPSLANGPQVSIDTVHTVKSAKSVRLGKASAGIRPAAVIVGKKMSHSANLLGLEKRQHTAAESGGGATSSNTAAPTAITTVATTASVGSSAGPAAVSEINDNGNSIKRSSWWGFFGMGKKKRNSNQSI